MQRFRSLFPIVDRYTYLNHAAVGPPSARVLEATRDFELERARHGSLTSDAVTATVERTREKIARFIGAEPGEIAFLRNTPEGLSVVASGLGWCPGDNVVTASLEFPANVVPWLLQRDRGVEVRFVQPRDGRIDPEDVIGQIDGRTRVVALSWVEFCNGFRNQLRTIGRACRERDVLLAVDGIQGLGAMKLDVQDLCIDFFSAASHKWMLAPPGVGTFYCRAEVRDRLRLTDMGQGSVVIGSSYLEYSIALKPDSHRFESGFGNATGIAGLEAAVDLFQEAGPEAIEEHILGLGQRLIDGLEEYGYEVWGPREKAERSGIVSFRHPVHDAQALCKRLEEAGVVVCVREGAVRVSPHFYNTADEVDRLLAALPR